MEYNKYKVMALSMLIRTRLREFLDRTKDYTGFRANLGTHDGRHPAHSVVWYLFRTFDGRYSPENIIPELINSAFLWCETPEGHTHWSDLDHTWRKFVRKMLTSESLRDYLGISTQEE